MPRRRVAGIVVQQQRLRKASGRISDGTDNDKFREPARRGECIDPDAAELLCSGRHVRFGNLVVPEGVFDMGRCYYREPKAVLILQKTECRFTVATASLVIFGSKNTFFQVTLSRTGMDVTSSHLACSNSARTKTP